MKLVGESPLDPAAIAPEQIHALTTARLRARKVVRAANTAAFSGWTCAVFAVITLLLGIFSLPSFLLGLGLGAAALIELRCGKSLRRFDVRAPRTLALNQIALWFVLTAYSGWCIFTAITAPGMYDDYIRQGPEMAATLEPLGRLHTAVTVGFYCAVILISLVAQGCMALYYITRRRHVEAYLRSTPQWAVAALRAAA